MPRSFVDYATDNITVYRSCPYQCRYCYAWRLKLFASRIKRGQYNPVAEAHKYLNSRKKKTIVISFTSDPYPGYEEKIGLTRLVLTVLSQARQHKVMLLTKNPMLPVKRDKDLLRKEHFWLGTTVITLDNEKARYWEPYAPNPMERLRALSLAKQYGINTWLSIEPIIPETTDLVSIIERTKNYIDFYVLGSFNHAIRLGYTTYTKEGLVKWYKQQIPSAVDLLRSIGKRFHVKKELRRVMGNV